MSTTQPAPCPFCGHVGLSFREGSTFRWLAYSCGGCGMGEEVRVQTLGEGEPKEWLKEAELNAIKEWNRRQDVRMQSYHIEVIALKMATSCGDHSWAIRQWFEAAKQNVNFCWHANADVSAYLAWDRAARVSAQLQAASNLANSAWYSAYNNNHQQAITQWRSLFGQKFPTYG